MSGFSLRRSLTSLIVILGSPPFLNLASWFGIPLDLSNSIPISLDDQLQYEQNKAYGPWLVGAALSAERRLLLLEDSGSTALTWAGAVQTGHW